jgi:hypothetical protein
VWQQWRTEGEAGRSQWQSVLGREKGLATGEWVRASRCSGSQCDVCVAVCVLGGADAVWQVLRYPVEQSLLRTMNVDIFDLLIDVHLRLTLRYNFSGIVSL